MIDKSELTAFINTISDLNKGQLLLNCSGKQVNTVLKDLREVNELIISTEDSYNDLKPLNKNKKGCRKRIQQIKS